jgi:hypothetical protein
MPMKWTEYDQYTSNFYHSVLVRSVHNEEILLAQMIHFQNYCADFSVYLKLLGKFNFGSSVFH